MLVIPHTGIAGNFIRFNTGSAGYGIADELNPAPGFFRQGKQCITTETQQFKVTDTSLSVFADQQRMITFRQRLSYPDIVISTGGLNPVMVCVVNDDLKIIPEFVP
jgi:hypothetical protein